MPEVFFEVRWPDGALQRCVSPSRQIEAALTAGATYPREEFLARTRAALERGSERVRAKYGFACTAAAQQIVALEETAAGHAPGTPVTVTKLRRAPERPRHPAPDALTGHHEVVIVGGGQAGLSLSHELTRAGVEHVVLERDRAMHTWRDERWDAFCLVTPNWQCRLPGLPYDGDDPDGFMVQEEILAYLDRFLQSFDPPLHEGVTVTRVSRSGDAFVVQTSHGTLTAGQVVLAVGGYHVPSLPRVAAQLPSRITQLHSSQYRNPSSLPDGEVLVVGSGQSGAQIAEDLLIAGRTTHLCVGSAPRVARFYRGRDCVAWLADMGHYDMGIDEHPEGTAARKEANHYVTGRDGGRDIDLRAHALGGMRLHGRLLSVVGETAALGTGLTACLDAADATADRIKDRIDAYIDSQGIDAPDEPRYVPVWAPAAEHDVLDLSAISTVVWATGFRSNWSWVDVPCFDGSGYPVHTRGVTSVPGLFVLGLPWLHTWGSGRFAGIARDAAHLAGVIAAPAAKRLAA